MRWSKWIVLTVLVSITLASCATTDRSTRGETRIALVIGNANYHDDSLDLDVPTKDAQGVAQNLERLRFRVDKRENLDYAEMRNAIVSFVNKLEPQSIGFFYYSGHGIQENGKTYMVPVDANLKHGENVNNPKQGVQHLIGLETLIKSLPKENKGNFVILDACRNNQSGEGLAEAIEQPRNTTVAYAAQPGKTASNIPAESGYSIYTEALIREIGVPGQKARIMFNNVANRVSAATNWQQNPYTSQPYSLEGFVFRPFQATPIPGSPA